MSLLQKLGFIKSVSKSAHIFEEIVPDFRNVQYKFPSEYISKIWAGYENGYSGNQNLNGNVFELILATLLTREGIIPLYLQAKVAFVPNVKFDLLGYTNEKGPICFSAKTSLRERYKQADLEAIALKYVHRKAECYLITLNHGEADMVKNKIKNGDVIGIDKVIKADTKEFDNFLEVLPKKEFTEAGNINIIGSEIVVKNIAN